MGQISKKYVTYILTFNQPVLHVRTMDSVSNVEDYR